MAKKEKAQTEKQQFTVADLAEAVGKEAFEVRAQLRRAGVEKVDGKYVWNGQKEFDAVVKKLKNGSKAEATEEKPAKKKKAPETKVESAPEAKSGKKDRVKPNAKRSAE